MKVKGWETGLQTSWALYANTRVPAEARTMFDPMTLRSEYVTRRFTFTLEASSAPCALSFGCCIPKDELSGALCGLFIHLADARRGEWFLDRVRRDIELLHTHCGVRTFGRGISALCYILAEDRSAQSRWSPVTIGLVTIGLKICVTSWIRRL